MVHKLAAQMYTIRDFTKTAEGLADSLRRLSAMGYPAVQLSAVGAMNGPIPEVSAQNARRMLDDNGLRCIATHRSWDDLKNHTEAEIDFHRELACDFVAIGGLPGAYHADGEMGYHRFLTDAAPVIAKLKSAGIRFGYHNHDHEFQRYAPGPRTLFDILIEEGAPDLMIELDVYWANHAGANPARILRRAATRVPVIHVKDKEVVAKEGPVMAPVGEGNLDWEEIIAAGESAGVEWYAVEQDICRRDPFDCLQSSLDFLQTYV